MESATIRIPARFNGPPGSANGGYACGLAAAALGAAPAEVTLHAPPPLQRDMAVARDGAAITLRDGATVVARARPAPLDLSAPAAVTPEQAGAAARAGWERWSAKHPFPGCVVCGPDRAPGDGLRLFPGPLPGGSRFACPWTPHESVADAEGAVLHECVWAALDCPTSAPVANYGAGPALVLGRLTASLDAPVRAGAPHVVVSWEVGRDGRKRTGAAALYDGHGTVLARSLAVWIELRE